MTIKKFDPRARKVKILATIGPASRDPDMLRRLFKAGADAFRVNMSHGEHSVHGEPIRAIRALEPVTDDVVVISCHHVQVPKGIRVLPDARPGHGPLGGLHAALLEAEARELHGVLLLGCDLPLVDERVLAAIVAQLGTSLAASSAAAPSRTGGVEPLCAVYGCVALPLVAERLDGTDLSMHSLFRALEGRELDLASLGLLNDETFLNVNTPEDLVKARLHQNPE